MGRPNWVRPGALVDDGRNVTQADLSWCMEEVTQPSLIHSPQTPQFMHSRVRAHSLRLLSEGKRIPKHALTHTHRVQECSCRGLRTDLQKLVSKALPKDILSQNDKTANNDLWSRRSQEEMLEHAQTFSLHCPMVHFRCIMYVLCGSALDLQSAPGTQPLIEHEARL